MADISIPTLAELIQRMKQDMLDASGQPGSFILPSMLEILIVGVAGGNFPIWQSINALQNALRLSTATDDFLDQFGFDFGVPRLTASPSVGVISVTGINNTTIAAGEQLQSSAGVLYITQAQATIQPLSITPITITSVGLTATVTSPIQLSLATGNTVTITGAIEPEYNGSFVITMITDTTFSYTLPSATTTPATGTISLNTFTTTILIQSVAGGTDTRQISGTPLVFVNIIGSVDNNQGFVDLNGIAGGENTENDQNYRTRLERVNRNPPASSSVSQIEQLVFTVNGVTRVKVRETTPVVGQITVTFVRDDDPSIIPTPAELIQVKDTLLSIIGGEMGQNNLFVNAPLAVIVDFDFAAISPNTSSMRDAVQASLIAFFRSQPLGVTISEEGYLCAIFNTLDLQTGEQLQSFTLTSPSGNILLNPNEVAIVGDITYA